ncbi:MAG: hypothetical protein JNJ54_14450 [Myxococcaceae bacterium]|nr:hypothetical protein [Myxococcaceae bacterium]
MRWLLALLLVAGCRCPRPDVTDVSDEVRVEPASLDFGPVYVGRTATRALVLTNAGRASKRVTLATAAPFQVGAGLDVGGGESVEVFVAFAPSSPGPVEGAVSLTGAASQTVALTGVGLEVPVCASPTACQANGFDFERGACVSSVLADGTACSNACLVSGTCVSGECRGAVSAACDDRDACTVDACGAEGACVHVALECAVTDPCTVAFCDPAMGCQTRPVDDGTACGEETCRDARVCINGQCVVRQRPGAVEECTPVDLAASYGSTCMLTRAGTLRCWGSGHATPGNIFSRPGTLRRAGRASTLSMGVATCSALEAGGFQCGDGSAPPRDAGTVVSVVNNGSGACWVGVDAGVGCQVQSWMPSVTGLALTSLTADDNSFCGVALDGGVACWGYLNDVLPPGDAGFVGVAEFALRAPVRALRRGDRGTCALLDDGIDCWAAMTRTDGAGQPGPPPASVVRLPATVHDVAVSYRWGDVTPVLRDGGVLRCAFESDGGLSCVTHDAGLPPVRKAAGGTDHVCFLTTSDEVACIGSNRSAELGDLSPAPPSPSEVPGLRLERLAFGLGVRSVVGVLRDGGVVTWGAGVARPAFLPLPAAGAKEVASVPDGTCVVQADGGADCWDGALHRIAGVPPLVGFLPCVSGSGFVAGLSRTGVPCAFRPSGADVTCNPLAEAPAACGFADARCSVVGDGGVVCDGTNRYGQLGTGDTTERFRQTAVPLPGPAMKVAMSQVQACALVAGQAWCWGLDVSTGRPMTPSPLARVLPFARDLACGSSHCCVLVGSNGVSCWGSNLFNELGREGSHSALPVPVALPGRVAQLVAREGTTCALLADGALWCWGDNREAQRGVPPLLFSSAPVFVR